MATTLPSTLCLLAQSTRLAADSVGSVDRQVQSVLAMPVPPVQQGSLQTDLQKTKTDASAWPAALRAEVISTMQQLVSCAAELEQQAQTAQTLDGAALEQAVALLQARVTALAARVRAAASDVGSFRAAIDADTSRLSTDLNGFNQQISALQQQVQQLAQQVQDQQARIQYYQDHPWMLILAAVSLAELFSVADEVLSAERAAQQAIAQIQGVEQTLQPLLQGVGPLQGLLTGVTGLSGGLINLGTAIDEAANSLGRLDTGGAPEAVVVAELQTLAENFAQARQIANEILQS